MSQETNNTKEQHQKSTISRESIADKLANPLVPLPGSRWKHYKGGIYSVDFIGVHSSTGELEVCYHSLKDEDSIECLWIRPLCEWNQVIAMEEGRVVNRFTPISGDDQHFVMSIRLDQDQ